MQKTRLAMDVVGIQKETQESVFKAVAAVLHLGNISFDAVDDDEARISQNGEEALKVSARLLGVPIDGLRKLLTTRTRRTVDGPIISPINVESAINTRDAFAKTLYSRTFDWLVECINTSIGQDANPVSVIGVLDIYGFEEFARNDFEQFCINFANEKLQQHFNQHVFKMEQKEYEDEGIEWSYIEFVDNQDVLDIIEGTGSKRAKQPGILDLLDETCKFPRADHKDFAQKLYSSDFIANTSRFKKPKLSQEDFVIEHYAGPVQYSTFNFLEKNKDFVVLEHQELLSQSTEAFVRTLYPGHTETSDSQSSFKFSSVSSRFSKQLGDLMLSLQQMEPHYIRCIKPNKAGVPMEFENPSVLQQLRCGGVLEAVRISCAGYPSKRTYEEFYNHFWMMCLDGSDLDDEEITKQIIQKHLPQNDTQFGKTRVFLRAGRMAELEKMRMELQNSSATLIQSHVKSWLTKMMFKEKIAASVVIQSSWRTYLARQELNRRISDSAALRIQTVYRAYQARKHFISTVQAIRLIQRMYRAHVREMIERENIRNSATLLIQTYWRTYSVQRQFNKMIRVVILAQSLWRAKLAKAKVAKLKTAARESGKLMKDKENLQRKIEKLLNVSDTLKNQRNDLREQLRLEKASKCELESALRAEIDEKGKKFILLESHLEEMKSKLVLTKENYESMLSEAREDYEKEKAVFLEERHKEKTFTVNQEARIRELEDKLSDNEKAFMEKTSEIQDELRRIELQRDKAREEAQIANGLHGSSMVTPGAGHLIMSRSRTSTDEERDSSSKSAYGREHVSDIDRMQREVLAKQQQLLREQRVADQEHLIDALKLNLGFQQGKPVAAVVIFRSFVHWKAIQQEKGTIFDRVSEAIGLQIEAYHDDNERLGYWLTNTAALYYLMQRHTKPAGTAGESGITARLRFSGQQAAKGFLSYFGRSPGKTGTPDGNTPRDLQDPIVQYEARYAALLFKQGLGALVQTIFPFLRDNIKREISSYLGVCMNISGSHGGRVVRRGSKHEVENDNDHLMPWKEILRILNELLLILQENYVPHMLASKLMEQLFTIINVNLFNQLMLKRDCCSFSNGEYVKMGLAEIEQWVVSTGTEWVGTSWEKLSHLRQAVTFLVIHQKARKTLEEIKNDLCPSLSVQQIYRLSTMYWDDRFGTESVSHQVLSQLKVMMTSEGQHTQNLSFLLDEDSAIPFTTDELGATYDGLGLLESLVEIPPELMKPGGEEPDREDRFSYLTR
jgi:myosin V